MFFGRRPFIKEETAQEIEIIFQLIVTAEIKTPRKVIVSRDRSEAAKGRIVSIEFIVFMLKRIPSCQTEIKFCSPFLGRFVGVSEREVIRKNNMGMSA